MEILGASFFFSGHPCIGHSASWVAPGPPWEACGPRTMACDPRDDAAKHEALLSPLDLDAEPPESFHVTFETTKGNFTSFLPTWTATRVASRALAPSLRA